ncbi:hypothetical protein [Jeongeupia naejangsanensis]|uniref:Flagellar protein FlgJ N-terminal domain-containing protein n=1 Tax=Jeongeupia naejangsanensis TaxID=613195 RepID=A0ABS2BIB3_9NEIS|nr:hypothetical protein [Jeongeupia naejangsanensis]MBM3114696.1 hypothetical protein [Jeongeupia naejangsanensis]
MNVTNTPGIEGFGRALAGEQEVQPLPPATDPAYRKKVEKAAEQFEGMFIAQMFREMRKVTREMSSEDSVFRNKVDGDMLDFADTAVADVMAKQRSFGIANAILHQLLPPGAASTDETGGK